MLYNYYIKSIIQSFIFVNTIVKYMITIIIFKNYDLIINNEANL